MYYRDYENFSTNSFREHLTLSLDRINKGFDSFEDTFMKNLNRHAPIKIKFVRANNVPYVTKPLRKTITKRSDLESKYLKIKSFQNIKIYKKLKKTFAVNYVRRKFYSKTHTCNMTDNKTFWKTTTSFISSKTPSLFRISLIENKAILSEDQKVVETLSKFYVKAVNQLNTKVLKNISNLDGISDPVEITINKYENHPNITAFTEKFKFKFNFKVTEKGSVSNALFCHY